MSNCNVCHKPLKRPESIQRGIGPICWGRLMNERDHDNDSPHAVPALPMDPETMDVVCERVDGETRFNVPHRIVYHSPSGMEFGYAGSGPADFALNALALFEGEDWARQYHQDFKRAFIAALPEKGGTIRGADIRAWIAEQKRLGENMPLPLGGAGRVRR